MAWGLFNDSVMTSLSLWLSSVIFFFQAEDGIRDDLVTGVQTCALPILGASAVPQVTSASDDAPDAARASGRSNVRARTRLTESETRAPRRGCRRKEDIVRLGSTSELSLPAPFGGTSVKRPQPDNPASP